MAFEPLLTRNMSRPDSRRIDVEGFEREVLQGASALLHHAHPMLMVEIQANREAILQRMQASGYRMLTPAGRVIRRPDDLSASHMNTFCFHEQAHAPTLRRLEQFAA